MSTTTLEKPAAERPGTPTFWARLDEWTKLLAQPRTRGVRLAIVARFEIDAHVDPVTHVTLPLERSACSTLEGPAQSEPLGWAAGCSPVRVGVAEWARVPA